MTISLNKRRELRAKLRSVQQELNKVSMERNFLSDEHLKRKYVNLWRREGSFDWLILAYCYLMLLHRKLEEDLVICESEKIDLQNKLRELERSKSSMDRSVNSKAKNVSNSNSRNSSKEEKMEHVEKQRKDANIEEKIHLAITVMRQISYINGLILLLMSNDLNHQWSSEDRFSISSGEIERCIGSKATANRKKQFGEISFLDSCEEIENCAKEC